LCWEILYFTLSQSVNSFPDRNWASLKDEIPVGFRRVAFEFVVLPLF